MPTCKNIFKFSNENDQRHWHLYGGFFIDFESWIFVLELETHPLPLFFISLENVPIDLIEIYRFSHWRDIFYNCFKFSWRKMEVILFLWDRMCKSQNMQLHIKNIRPRVFQLSLHEKWSFPIRISSVWPNPQEMYTVSCLHHIIFTWYVFARLNPCGWNSKTFSNMWHVCSTNLRS